jgi:Xaa-Pro aminopeptidase
VIESRSSAGLPISLVSERLGEIQLALREKKMEGWLFADHRGQNRIALRALGLGPESGRTPPSRRLFYWLPADGMPVVIAHALELDTLPELPGEQLAYTGWAELRRALERTLPTRGSIAMEHATIAASPDVSRVEAGTVGLVESYGARVVSSIELANAYVGTLRDAEVLALRDTLRRLGEVRTELTKKLRGPFTPIDVAREATALMATRELVVVEPPMIASGGATRSWPREAAARAVGDREYVLVDLFARRGSGPCAHVGVVYARGESKIAERMLRETCAMRDAAIALVEARLAKGDRLLGFEVDEAARAAAGKLDRANGIRHRTGSHVGTVPFSGEACTFDALELSDTRPALAGHAWSVHPGLYDDAFGIRAHAVILATPRGCEVIDRGADRPIPIG